MVLRNIVLYSSVPYKGWFLSQGEIYTPINKPSFFNASDRSFSTSPFPLRHALSLTVCWLNSDGKRQNPSWCFAVIMMPFAPAFFAVEAHCAGLNSVGLKIVGISVPFPHSIPLNVFGPKCTNR